MLPAAASIPEPTVDPARDREVSFEASLAARSAEFEAEKAKSAREGNGNAEVATDVLVESSEMLSANAPGKGPYDGSKAKKAKGMGKAAKAKLMMKANPYMYDPYAMMAMQQQQMWAQQSWADTEQDDEDWWYLSCC